mmetsp:Transcript_81559/g.198047  ORF Transcript_81559/g.198047 Transcript_81559/m.198047 type:complete len:206 (+) Transcript_81559:1059-1676(+)
MLTLGRGWHRLQRALLLGLELELLARCDQHLVDELARQRLRAARAQVPVEEVRLPQGEGRSKVEAVGLRLDRRHDLLPEGWVVVRLLPPAVLLSVARLERLIKLRVLLLVDEVVLLLRGLHLAPRDELLVHHVALVAAAFRAQPTDVHLFRVGTALACAALGLLPLLFSIGGLRRGLARGAAHSEGGGSLTAKHRGGERLWQHVL